MGIQVGGTEKPPATPRTVLNGAGKHAACVDMKLASVDKRLSCAEIRLSFADGEVAYLGIRIVVR